MLRKIVRIDKDKCNGCGLCLTACAEGALKLLDGKAVLVSDACCDGLGACLPKCPADAITIVEHEAAAFDDEAARAHAAASVAPAAADHEHGDGCPGSRMRALRAPAVGASAAVAEPQPSALSSWPVQLSLVPPHAPFLKGANILVCADCVPFALASFHQSHLAGRAVLVGCPKLDDLTYYREKLQQILAAAGPASVTVLRMEVPCCAGIAAAVVAARDAVAPELPVRIETVGIEGGILNVEEV